MILWKLLLFNGCKPVSPWNLASMVCGKVERALKTISSRMHTFDRTMKMPRAAGCAQRVQNRGCCRSSERGIKQRLSSRLPYFAASIETSGIVSVHSDLVSVITC